MYAPLLNAGVEIHEYRTSFLHAKVAVIDDRVTIGSSNIDPFSLLMAREANLWVNAREFAQQLRSRLNEAINEHCNHISPDAYARRSQVRKMLDLFALGLLRLSIQTKATS